MTRQVEGARRPPVWLQIGLYLLMTGVVVYPVLVVQIPDFGDYLNHLARMHILSAIEHSNELRRFYRLAWQPIPYLSMDVAFLFLNHVATIYNAGRIFVGICVLLPVLSVTILHYTAYRRLSFVPLSSYLFCYNYLLAWGFLNYLPALCLSVIVYAGWIGTVGWPRWRRSALFCVLALLLYFSHLVAFGAYCLMVGGFEFAQAWRAGFRPWRMIVANWSAAALQAVPAVIFALTVNLERPFAGAVQTDYGDLPNKLVAFASPILFFGNRVDLMAGAFVLMVFGACLLTRQISLAPAVWPAALMVGIASIVMPHILLGTFGMDYRLPLLVVLLLLGATTTTERMSRFSGISLLSGFLVLAAVHAISIMPMLRTLDEQLSEVRQVVAEMPRGMRLLIIETLPDEQNQHVGPAHLTWHMGLVAVIDRDAFVPFLFTGLSTVRPVPSMRASSTPHGLPPGLSALTEGLGRSDNPIRETEDGGGGRIYWLGWEHKFDYVLILHFGSKPTVVPTVLRLAASSKVADLYKIDNSVSP